MTQLWWQNFSLHAQIITFSPSQSVQMMPTRILWHVSSSYLLVQASRRQEDRLIGLCIGLYLLIQFLFQRTPKIPKLRFHFPWEISLVVGNRWSIELSEGSLRGKTPSTIIIKTLCWCEREKIGITKRASIFTIPDDTPTRLASARKTSGVSSPIPPNSSAPLSKGLSGDGAPKRVSPKKDIFWYPAQQ